MIEDDAQEARRFAELFRASGNAQLVAHVDNLRDACIYLEKWPIEGVILDLRLPNGGWGGDFLEMLNHMNLTTRPAIVITTWISSSYTLDHLSAKGIDRVFLKSDPGYAENGPMDVLAHLLAIRPYVQGGAMSVPLREELTPQKREEKAVRQIGDMLISFGGRPGSKDLIYMTHALWAGAKRKGLPIVLKTHIYPVVRERMNASSDEAVKAGLIRFVNYLWSPQHDPDKFAYLLSQYKPSVKPSAGAPTMDEFLSYFATIIEC